MAEQDRPALPEIDLDACEVDALIGCLTTLENRAIRLLAAGAPRRIPSKQWRSRESLERALSAQWALDAGRRYLVAAMRSAMAERIGEIRSGGLAAAARLADESPPNSLLWYAAQAGLQPADVLASLPDDGRALFASRQATLQQYAAHLRSGRKAKVEAGVEAQRRTAAQEAARMTRALRWEAAKAQEKLAHTQRAVERVARAKADEIRRLEDLLAAAEGRIAQLQGQVQDLQREIADMRRDFSGRAAERGGRQQEHGPRPLPHLPLAGQVVLVVGDENRRVAYRKIVEELGGRFEFVSGFGNPGELRTKARAATLVAFVTAFASHKMWVQVRAAEPSGVALVPIAQAGVQSFRDALLAWARSGRGTAPPSGER